VKHATSKSGAVTWYYPKFSRLVAGRINFMLSPRQFGWLLASGFWQLVRYGGSGTYPLATLSSVNAPFHHFYPDIYGSDRPVRLPSSPILAGRSAFQK